MNDRDLDLILALAEGRLTGAARDEAEARVASDPELARELELQRIAIGATTDVDPVVLTEAERGRLRAAIRAELRLDETAAAPAPVAAPSRWMRWLAPAMGVAAVVVVGLVVVGNNLGGSDSVEEAAARLDTTTVEAAGGGEDTMTTTTAAGAGDFAAPESATVPLYATESEDLEEAVGTDDVSLLGEPKGTRSVDIAALEDCREMLPELASADELTVRGVAEVDGREVVLVAVATEDGSTEVLVVDLAVCELVDPDDG